MDTLKGFGRLCAFVAATTMCSAAFASTAGETLDDNTLQSRVKAALVGDNFGEGLSINTEVRNGIVQLNGLLDDKKHADRAVEVAKGVEGVVKVDNQLHVKPGDRSMGQSLDDKVISTKVKSAVSDVSDGLGVLVDTWNGTVYLSGFVDTSDLKKACAEAAAKVDNVKNVVNGIYALK
jgi:hyperosmotically inducible protein